MDTSFSSFKEWFSSWGNIANLSKTNTSYILKKISIFSWHICTTRNKLIFKNSDFNPINLVNDAFRSLREINSIVKVAPPPKATTEITLLGEASGRECKT